MNQVTNRRKRGILQSWKEIASYLGLGVRTVQRYESRFALPVHRPAARSRSSVAAFADELDAWLRQSPTLRQHRAPYGSVCPLCSGTGSLPTSRSNSVEQVVCQSPQKLQKLTA